MTTSAIILAAGAGGRFGGPKQFADLAGRRVIDWSIDAARAAGIEDLIVVTPGIAIAGVRCVLGGPTRTASVRAGLEAVPDTADTIVIHDGARPLATTDLWQRVLEARAAGTEAVVPVAPLVDTIWVEQDEDYFGRRPSYPIDRSRLRAVQTPQAFDAELLRNAHAAHADESYTDDSSLAYVAALHVTLIAGEPGNLKITEPVDLFLAQGLVDARARA